MKGYPTPTPPDGLTWCVILRFGDKMKILVIRIFSGMKSPSATPTFHYGGQAGEFIRYKAILSF